MDKYHYIYILTNWNNKVLYIGETRDLSVRLKAHKDKIVPGFTQKYNVTKPVYVEVYDSIMAAKEREKELKGWNREKKNRLIRSENPYWEDITDQLEI